MFTEQDKKRKNWRSQKRALRKARGKVKRLKSQIANGRHIPSKLPALRVDLQDAEIKVSVLELKVGDKPE